MRFATLACAVLLAGSSLAGEAAAMRLATFDFEGTIDSALTVPETVSGSFTIDLDATYSESRESFPDAIVEFTVSYNSGQGVATGEYEPGGFFGRSPFLAIPRQGVAIVAFGNGNALAISAPISGEPGFIYQTFRPFFSVSDTYLEINGFEISAFAAGTETGLTSENILAFADQGMTFVLFGRTSEQGTVAIESSPTSDFFAPEPDPNEFIREGTIDSVTLVSEVPLPAAAWLMLSGLAALVGVRAWPRARGLGGAS